MKTLKTIGEIKSLADVVKKQNDTEVARVVLTKEIVEFLYSIFGRNRNLSAGALTSIYGVIDKGQWDKNSSQLSINASMNWLVCGHHRIFTILETARFGLESQIQILTDEDAKTRYLNDDVVVKKRTASAQAQEFFSIPNAKDIETVVRWSRNNTGFAQMAVIPEDVRDFYVRHCEKLNGHKFNTALVFADKKKHYRVPRPIYAIATILEENGSPFKNVAWDLIDAIHDRDTKIIPARYIKQIVSDEGQKSNKAVDAFMKAVVKFDDIERESQCEVKGNETMDKYRISLGISNNSDRKKAEVGSFSFFRSALTSSGVAQTYHSQK